MSANSSVDAEERPLSDALQNGTYALNLHIYSTCSNGLFLHPTFAHYSPHFHLLRSGHFSHEDALWYAPLPQPALSRPAFLLSKLCFEGASRSLTMKSSTATAVVESPLLISRRQPIRQTRTNPSRNATNTSRLFGARAALDESQVEMAQRDNAPGFYPAITHFTDSIDALPKEMIRNYTMLKEVDAKIFAPEEGLRQMVSAALKSPTPARKDYGSQRTMDGQPYYGRISNPGAAVPINGTDAVAGAFQDSANPHNGTPTNFDLADLPRRKLFFHLRMLAGEMLATLDEKNHVLSVAADTLDRQLARCESSYPYINNEISEETRYGNLNHWAYMDKTTDKKGTTANERTRRETATGNGLTVGSVHEGELAAMRSEARREALAAKKRMQPVDSDFDDNRVAKKTNTGKGKKVVDTSSTPTTIGLGITNGSSSAAMAVSNKRRKIEKSVAVPVVEGLGVERSLNAAYGSTAMNSRGGGGSPRDTPTTENPKKRVRTSTITNSNGSTNRRHRHVQVILSFSALTVAFSQSRHQRICYKLTSHCLFPCDRYLLHRKQAREQPSTRYDATFAIKSGAAKLHTSVSGRPQPQATSVLGIEQTDQWHRPAWYPERSRAVKEQHCRQQNHHQGCCFIQGLRHNPRLRDPYYPHTRSTSQGRRGPYCGPTITSSVHLHQPECRQSLED